MKYEVCGTRSLALYADYTCNNQDYISLQVPCHSQLGLGPQNVRRGRRCGTIKSVFSADGTGLSLNKRDVASE